MDASYLLANLLCVFFPLFGIEIWGNSSGQPVMKTTWNHVWLAATLFASSILCTLFDFRLSEGLVLNLSILPLTMGFFVLTWRMGLLVLLLFVLYRMLYSLWKLSQGHVTLQTFKTVVSMLPQGLGIICVFGLIMCACSVATRRLSFSRRAAGFAAGLLLYALSDYVYIHHFNRSLHFNVGAFIGFILAVDCSFIVIARLIVASLEKKRANRELILREEVYRRLVEESPDAVAISKDRQWVFVNNALAELFGSDKERLLSTPSYRFVHEDYIEQINRRLNQVELGRTAELTEQVLLKANGEPFLAETLSIPTIYRGETAIHTIIRDITHRKKEQDLLIQAEKLSVSGQLAAGIAHEIRNPLTTMKGFLKLIQANPKEEYFGIVSAEMDRIEEIVTELLLFSKPNRNLYRDADIILALKQVVSLMEAQANLENIAIETHYAADPFRIFCDENKLKQAFINFVKNAIEAMPDGGTLRIRAENERTRLRIEIRDDGVGIPEDKLKLLGSPFYTTKENGTGLGFMVSRKIIEDHQGRLAVTSAVGQGTAISLLLPAAGQHVS
ncbi:ATP-binding protein [Cohnella caldifontis]|uniref:ATP-binding protein n=1 Tax=Cohnella caldifontis TaxID=3027471 RepID=UPI0023EAAE6E|nr:ATP-binding protein [Cohnella sp. YIM B05605]